MDRTFYFQNVNIKLHQKINKKSHKKSAKMDKIYRLAIVLTNFHKFRTKRHFNSFHRRFQTLNSREIPSNIVVFPKVNFVPKTAFFSAFTGLSLLPIDFTENSEHSTKLSRAIKYGNKSEIIRQLKSGLDPNARHPLGEFFS